MFAFGTPLPKDPTRIITSFKTAWTDVRKEAGVKGRWHDNRHASHGTRGVWRRRRVSRAMLSRYSRVRMEAKP